jgi:hypothetical protein
VRGLHAHAAQGVDFPTKTVICAHPPQTKGTPQVGRLRNLAGRAGEGRGGLFTSGSLIVTVESEAQVQKWMRAFRAELPPTTSALHQALDHLRSTADHLADADPGTPLATVDAVILEAIADGATVDGEPRQDLEALLARTLWYQGAHPALRDFVLTRAAQRAERLRSAVPPGPGHPPSTGPAPGTLVPRPARRAGHPYRSGRARAA